MDKKITLIALSLIQAFSLAGYANQASAATFCGDRPNVTWGGDSTISGDLGADQCYEIGAGLATQVAVSILTLWQAVNLASWAT